MAPVPPAQEGRPRAFVSGGDRLCSLPESSLENHRQSLKTTFECIIGSEMGQKVWRFFFLGYIVEAGSCHESISGASLVMKASVLS